MADAAAPPESVLRSQQYEVVPIDSVVPHPENPHRGDRRRIAQSIAANGFYGAVLVQEAKGKRKKRRIIAGEHRWREVKAAGEGEVPVIVLDVDDDRAKAIMLMDNRSMQHATEDQQTLAGLLAELAEKDLLGDAGYAQRDLQDLLSALDVEAPTAFPAVDPASMDLQHECPRCGYEW